jgi:hypothetical protein
VIHVGNVTNPDEALCNGWLENSRKVTPIETARSHAILNQKRSSTLILNRQLQKKKNKTSN